MLQDTARYGVATVSRIDKIVGLFCKRALWKRRSSAKETYDFIDPTDYICHVARHCEITMIHRHMTNVDSQHDSFPRDTIHYCLACKRVTSQDKKRDDTTNSAYYIIVFITWLTYAWHNMVWSRMYIRDIARQCEITMINWHMTNVLSQHDSFPRDTI